MAEGGEMRGFVFCITFIIVFSALLSSVPAGLQGVGADPDIFIPVDPSMLVGFDEKENFTKSAFTGTPKTYAYTLNNRDWSILWVDLADDEFYISALVYVWIFWLGGTDPCKFIGPDGTDYDTGISIDDIEADATNGFVRYSLLFITTGHDAGSFIAYWNTTLYTDPQDAHDNDVLQLAHGVGFSNSATNDIGALLIGLLTLSLPDVPALVNFLLATPMWSCIIFVLWYVIKSMIPFLG